MTKREAWGKILKYRGRCAVRHEGPNGKGVIICRGGGEAYDAVEAAFEFKKGYGGEVSIEPLIEDRLQ